VRPARSLRLRLLAAAAVWVGIALLLAGLVFDQLLRSQFQQLIEARLDAEMLGIMAAVEFDETGTIILLREPAEPAFERVGSGWYWQVSDEDTSLLSSRSLRAASLDWPAAVPGQGIGSARAVTADRRELLVRWRMFSAPGDARQLLIQVTAPLDLLSGEMQRIRVPLMIALLVLGGGLLLAVWLQISFGLKPLAEVRSQLAAVRAGESDRIAPAPVTEIAPLTAEINALIAHGEGAIQHARTHVGNLAHSLKTPLAAILNHVRASSDPGVRQLEQELLRMQQLTELHLRRAQLAGGPAPLSPGTAVAPVAREMAALLQRVHQERGIKVQLDVAEELRFPGEAADLQELLGNLLDNALKWAYSEVRLTAVNTADGIALSVEDDGPGMAASEFSKVTARGVRLDEQVAGHGLGLAIIQDLCQLYGGQLSLKPGRMGGLCATIQVPRRHSPPGAHQ